jgi:hypothetical protein
LLYFRTARGAPGKGMNVLIAGLGGGAAGEAGRRGR